jgi:hypothetical protein
METIGNNYKKAINNNLIYNLIERSADGVASAINVNVKDSNHMHILPNVEKVELEKIDDLHDKLSLYWADYKIEGVVAWKPSANKETKAMVFYGIR